MRLWSKDDKQPYFPIKSTGKASQQHQYFLQENRLGPKQLKKTTGNIAMAAKTMVVVIDESSQLELFSK